MAVLVLLRHGESEWNRKNLFAGWVDVDLTPAGEREARRAGDLLVEHGLLPDVVHTSLLRRAIRTAQITSTSPDQHCRSAHPEAETPGRDATDAAGLHGEGDRVGAVRSPGGCLNERLHFGAGSALLS